MSQATFSSVTVETKYYILNYLSENKDVPHSYFEITQAVPQHNDAIWENIISDALHTLWDHQTVLRSPSL